MAEWFNAEVHSERMVTCDVVALEVLRSASGDAFAVQSRMLSLLHYDHDFDLIASVSGRPARWLLPTGVLP